MGKYMSPVLKNTQDSFIRNLLHGIREKLHITQETIFSIITE